MSAVRRKMSTGRVFGTLVMYIVGILWVLPVLWMVSTSLKPESMIMEAVPRWIPAVFTLSNYQGC